MKFIYKWMDELCTADILLFTQSQTEETEGKEEESLEPVKETILHYSDLHLKSFVGQFQNV